MVEFRFGGLRFRVFRATSFDDAAGIVYIPGETAEGSGGFRFRFTAKNDGVTPVEINLPNEWQLGEVLHRDEALRPENLTKTIEAGDSYSLAVWLREKELALYFLRVAGRILHFKPCLDAMWPRERDP